MADRRSKRVAELIAPLRVTPDRKVSLSKDFDPGHTAGFLDEVESEELLQQTVELLADYQARLAAQDTYALLVVIQGLDASGKDGIVRHVMSGVNPQGVEVHSFKVPSAEELDHDYLWRFAPRLPARGQIGIFNRSHYEEVLVVRVHPENLLRQKLPAESRRRDVWTRRFREINDWERYLHDQGTRIVKLCLNISWEEQRRQFLERIDDPDKNWKFSAADVQERQHWDEYQRAFSAMLSATSTEWAPWHVIPADHRWFAHIAAAGVIADALVRIDPRYPKLDEAGLQALKEAKAQLETEAPEGGDAHEGAAEKPAAETAPAADKEAAAPAAAAPAPDGKKDKNKRKKSGKGKKG